MSEHLGLTIARRLIEEEAEKKTGSLDLGELGLTSCPPEIGRLSHLRRLSLGEIYFSEDGEDVDTDNSVGPNTNLEAWILPVGLDRLEHLDLSIWELAEIPSFVQRLNLTSINLSYSDIEDLSPLATLHNLTAIRCSCSEVSDLSPIANLAKLTSLDCSQSDVIDLSPLANLRNLKSFVCWLGKVADLAPLASIQSLVSINCNGTQVTDLSPLAHLQNLTCLRVSATKVSDLAPLANLPQLTALEFFRTPVSDLRPLASLRHLASIDCQSTDVRDLGPLARLDNLSDIDCSHTAVSDLAPLATLHKLTTLTCFNTQVNDLSPVANLGNLSTLTFANTNVSDLSPLANLHNLSCLNFLGTRVIDLTVLSNLRGLTSITCSYTQVSELASFTNLGNITSIDCSNSAVSDLIPLANLRNLRSLDCCKTRVSELGPLSNCVSLESVKLDGTRVSDLGPLSNCPNLTSVKLNDTQVSDLRPLANCPNLTSIECSRVPVMDLTPLADLRSLWTIDCSHTLVGDLNPLASANVRTVKANNCRLTDIPRRLLGVTELRHLQLHETHIPGVPVEILSEYETQNCLHALRAHVADLSDGAAAVHDVKVIVIGNGRIGKTQICRRLMGLDFDETVTSTHGITVSAAPFKMPNGTPDVVLNLWDFGGQDLYHGTHSLFMRTRAVFVVVWTPAAERTEEYNYGGMRFRNQHLSYWLQYVRSLAGEMCPVVLVQNQCDTAEDEEYDVPADVKGFHFSFVQHVPYSAKTDRKWATLNDALQEGIIFLRKAEGIASIGIGRMKVRTQLLKWQHQDSRRPEAKRRHRTVTQSEFLKLCEKAGGVNSPDRLLEFLHNCGIVFYQRGIFDDQIVLDQSWALEAVYAIFQREKCFRQLCSLHGRFTRSLLDSLIWHSYSEPEQNLFLSLMTSCGICFVHRFGNSDIETEYVAPDLLPDRTLVQRQLAGRWSPTTVPLSRTWTYEFLHPGLIRTVMSKLGGIAGDTAVYWKYGLWAHAVSQRVSFILEHQMLDECRGNLVVEAQGDCSAELIQQLEKLIEVCSIGANSRFQVTGTDLGNEGSEAIKVRPEGGGGMHLRDSRQSLPRLEDPPRPKNERRVCVSYAWKDEHSKEPQRAGKVEQFCLELERAGITVTRDSANIGLGDRLSTFMRTIASGDVVYVFLSEAYLQSPNCMYELLLIWHGSLNNSSKFLGTIRVFPMRGTNIHSISARLEFAAHWRKERDKIRTLIEQNGVDILGPTELKNWKQILEFSQNVNEMLCHISDILLEGDFDKFIADSIGSLQRFGSHQG